MAAHHFRDYLDRPALLFQFGAYSGDEAVRSQAENPGLSRADARRDELVPVVGVGDGDCGVALLLDASRRGCKKWRRCFAGWEMVSLAVPGVGCGLRLLLIGELGCKG